MSNVSGYNRKRGRTLLIVEGNHEKNVLFRILFRLFPELSIDIHDVWIYGTNIYKLYQDIVKEYGDGWNQDDIDLPLLLSEKRGFEKCHKTDFVNIFLIFDYERHDPAFSETKIQEMQNYFHDSTDNGKLYLNYPMIESYQDVKSTSDQDYIDKWIPVTLQPGNKYKETVRDSFIGKIVDYPRKIRDLTEERFHLVDPNQLNKVTDYILNYNGNSNLEENLHHMLAGYIPDKDQITLINQIKVLIRQVGYGSGLNYWENTRNLFRELIGLNIDKAFRIQFGKGKWLAFQESLEDKYEQIEENAILEVQNEAGRDSEIGIIWVLNTCIMLVAEYNFRLIKG